MHWKTFPLEIYETAKKINGLMENFGVIPNQVFWSVFLQAYFFLSCTVTGI